MSVMGEIADSCATAIYRLSPGGLPRVSAVSGRQGRHGPLEGTLMRRLLPPKFVAAARVQGVRGSKLLRVQGEVAVAIAGAESPSETQTLGSYSDWRLINR